MEHRGDERKEGRRPFRRGAGERFEGKGSKKDFSSNKTPREDAMEELMELDGEIIHLVMKRSQLLSHFMRNGRIAPETEKRLRTSWEARAARMGRDSRLSRELFVLLQSIEAFSRPEEGRTYFNLEPNSSPVDADLTVPADSDDSLLWLAASAATGQPVKINGLALTDKVIDAVKAFNQLGAQIRWEENGDVTSSPSSGLEYNFDKIIHAGSSRLCLWLIIGMCAGGLSHAKITGDSSMILDLSELRRFLPQIGVRLTNVIPSQKGLPVRIECSGMIPEKIKLSDELPQDFCAVLLFCSAFWESECSFELPEKALPMLPLAEKILEGCGARIVRDGNEVRVEKIGMSLPSSPSVPMDAVISSSLLMLPGFNGGSVCLRGSWGKSRVYELARDILSDAGLDISYGSKEIICSGKVRETEIPSDSVLKEIASYFPQLLPLCAVIMAAAIYEGKKVVLDALDDETRYSLSVFLSYCGIHEKNGGMEADGEAALGAWIAPSAPWAMAFALCAFLMPKLRLSNPNAVNELFPQFWNIYNTLPRPQLKRKEEKEKEEDAKPAARRRIIAEGAYGELPAPVARDDF